MGLVAAIGAYVAQEDPRDEIASLVALVVASNQPFYPLYLAWILDGPVWPSYVTFLSTPFFAAVPAVIRRNSAAGRALLPATGIANGVLATWAFGTASGVELFLIPCVLLAALLFRPTERVFAGVLIAAAALVYFLGGAVYPAPLVAYSAADYAAFTGLNAASVAGLVTFIGLAASTRLAERR